MKVLPTQIHVVRNRKYSLKGKRNLTRVENESWRVSDIHWHVGLQLGGHLHFPAPLCHLLHPGPADQSLCVARGPALPLHGQQVYLMVNETTFLCLCKSFTQEQSQGDMLQAQGSTWQVEECSRICRAREPQPGPAPLLPHCHGGGLAFL